MSGHLMIGPQGSGDPPPRWCAGRCGAGRRVRRGHGGRGDPVEVLAAR
ncbi:hypothetical protein QJS66_17210 [Kocuria rhizophila]|nr:hypothetical protein QJS66_17210 [Kocuria rhizophila]